MKAITVAIITTAAMAAMTVAQAQTLSQDAPAAPRFYAGIGAVHATGDSGFSPKLFGGVDLANNLGVEAGYIDFRNQEWHNDYGGTRYDAKSKGYGAYLAGKYTVPLGERFSAYGKAGLAYGNWEYESKVDGASEYRYKSSDTGLYAALGGQYKLTEKVSLNAEYEHLGKTANTWSLGVKVGF